MVSPYFVPLQTISNTAARPALSGDPLSWHTSDGAPRSPARNITVARLPGTEGTTRGAPIAIEDTGWTAGISTSRFLAITADPSRPERLYAAGAGQREDLVSIYASQENPALGFTASELRLKLNRKEINVKRFGGKCALDDGS